MKCYHLSHFQRLETPFSSLYLKNELYLTWIGESIPRSVFWEQAIIAFPTFCWTTRIMKGALEDLPGTLGKHRKPLCVSVFLSTNCFRNEFKFQEDTNSDKHRRSQPRELPVPSLLTYLIHSGHDLLFLFYLNRFLRERCVQTSVIHHPRKVYLAEAPVFDFTETIFESQNFLNLWCKVALPGRRVCLVEYCPYSDFKEHSANSHCWEDGKISVVVELGHVKEVKEQDVDDLVWQLIHDI